MLKAWNIRCKECGEIIRVSYDSKKPKQDTFECKCGKLSFIPSLQGGFYNNGFGSDDLPENERNLKIYKYDEDYIKITPETERLLDEITELGDRIQYDLVTYNRIIFNKYCSKENIYIELIGKDEHNQICKIKVDIKLFDEEGWKNNRQRQIARLATGLKLFRDVELKILDEELDICNPTELGKNSEVKWEKAYRQSKNLYDYTFEC
jgi:hypothetical protein